MSAKLSEGFDSDFKYFGHNLSAKTNIFLCSSFYDLRLFFKYCVCFVTRLDVQTEFLFIQIFPNLKERGIGLSKSFNQLA
jgi:hypothetical protein